MNKFITLTDACTDNKVIINTYYIAYMIQYKTNNTIIYFTSVLNTKSLGDLACVLVKESLEEVQRKIYL